MTDITLRKDARGNWRASQRVDLGNQRVLNIVTVKVASGMLVTTATVAKVEGDFETHAMYQDFAVYLDASKLRCTKSNVLGLLYKARDAAGGLDAIVNLAKAHYADN